MVGEFPELQGVMGGIYAREEGLPEPVWKAIYHHYLPVGVEADAPPRRQDLGDAAVSWAAVSLADKLDTLVGFFHAGEQPTGSRDPFGLRRQAHGLCRILADLLELTGLQVRPSLGGLLAIAHDTWGRSSPEQAAHGSHVPPGPPQVRARGAGLRYSKRPGGDPRDGSGSAPACRCSTQARGSSRVYRDAGLPAVGHGVQSG